MDGWAVYFDDPVAYVEGVRLQEALHRARMADLIPDTVLFLQHRPVVTLGRRGREQHLRVNAADLAARGIDLHTASRGGDVTFHGPGQWVVYPILRLGAREADAHGYLHNLEAMALRTAADYGIRAYRRDGMAGAWTDEGKFAAIGFRLRRWVTMHGMSLNVRVDLSGFETMVPCGLVGEPVTSFERILGQGRCPTMRDVRESLRRHFETICSRKLIGWHWPDRLPEDWPADPGNK